MPIYNGTQKVKMSGIAKIYVGTQLVYQNAPALVSITLSGQTTSIDRGSAFSFGGTVTANYSNGSTADVTSSTTFSGYNMSTAGTYTVTASYTENGITVTATYNLTVNKIWSTLWSGTRDIYHSLSSKNWTKNGSGSITTGDTSSKRLRVTFSTTYTSNVSLTAISSCGVWWKGKSYGTRASSFGSSPVTVDLNSWGDDVLYACARTTNNPYGYPEFSIYTSSNGDIAVWQSTPSGTPSGSAKFGIKITKIEEYY